MNREEIRKFKFALGKGNVRFNSILYNYILKASSHDMEKIISMLSKEANILKKIESNLLPADLYQLNSQHYLCNTCSCEIILDWILFIVDLLKEKIDSYIFLKNMYESELFSNNFESALNVINRIEREVCVSLWSCKQKLFLEEKIGGLEKNKALLKQYLQKLEANKILQVLCTFYSKQAENHSSYENYQESVKKFLSYVKNNKEAWEYFNYKINLDVEFNDIDIASLIQLDMQISIIDIYETFIEIIQQIYANGFGGIDIYKLLSKIKISNDYRINNLKSTNNIEIPFSCMQQNKFYEILELYTIGKYTEAKSVLREYLDEYPADFQANILWIKCLIKLNNNIELEEGLLKDIYNIYVFNKNYQEAYSNIALHYKLLNGTTWKYKLKGLLDRKRNTIDSKIYKKMTYLNDNYITPSFAFNICERQIGIMWLQHLKRYCPISSKLFLRLYCFDKDENACNEILDLVRSEYYSAMQLSENQDFYGAISKLEALLNKQSEHDYYHIEKICRKLYYLYVKTKSLNKIINMSTNLYLTNENLIKKFDFQRIAKDIFDVSDIIKSDIRYPVFISIVDKNNVSQLRISYSNYMDHNKFEKIEDIVNKEQDICLLEYFLYNVCRIEIIKKDYRVIVSNENVEDIRISILRYLMNLGNERNKIYYQEMMEILTKKNIRNNVRHINHSRIFVDANNIKKHYGKQYSEEFEKYLVVKEFSNSVLEIDLNSRENSQTILDAFSEIRAKRDTDAKYEQDFLILKNLSEQILEQLLYNTKFGLDTFLSSRIRHGFCKSKIKSPFQHCNLLSKKEHEADDRYDINEYWEGKFSDEPELYARVNEMLSEFTIIVENKIKEVKNEWVKIKYGQELRGDFDYSAFMPTLFLVLLSDPINDFDNYYAAVVTHFELVTNKILSGIRSKIENELYGFFIDELIKLECRILSLDDPKCSPIINSINKCKTSVASSMSEFAEIFYLEKNTYDDFNFTEVVDTCIEINKNIDISFDKVKLEKNIKDNQRIKGDYFLFFIDIINQMINNAIEHSKLSHENLELNFVINSDIDDVINDVTKISSKFKYDKNEKYLNICLANNMSVNIKSGKIKEKLEGIFNEFNNPEVLQKYTRSEGGSGLYKIFTTLEYHIGEQYIIYYNVEQNCFKLGIIVSTSKLLSEGG